MATDVKTQVQELLKICKDENRGINSVGAKAILAELARMKERDLKQSISRAMRNINSKDMTLLKQINKAIKTLQENSPAQETLEPQGKKEEKKPEPKVEASDDKKKDKKPATKSDTQQLSDMQRKKLTAYALLASELGVDLSAVTRKNFGRTLSKLERRQVTIDLREYIFGRADKCSDFATDYIEAERIDDKYRKQHWKTVLNVLKNAIKPQKNGAEPNTDRLVEIAAKVSEISTNKKITEQASEFLKKITSQSEKQGEENMAEDTIKETVAEEVTEEAVTENKTEETAPKKYVPNETLKKMAGIAGVEWEGVENEETLIEKIQGAGYKVDGAKLLKLDGSNETEVNIEEELKKQTDEEEKKANPLKVSADTNEPQPQPAPQQDTEDRKWIEEKIAYYSALSSAGKIKDYQ